MGININGSLDADLVPADIRVNEATLAAHRSSRLAGSLVLVRSNRCGGSLGVDFLAGACGDGGRCSLNQGNDGEKGDDGGDLHVGLWGEERLLGLVWGCEKRREGRRRNVDM